jgi:GNAT superfamily N-acetyltransferase
MQPICDYSLTRVNTHEDWQSYHRIRAAVLFADGEYNPDHPDERKEGNVPLLLKHHGQAMGPVRMDKQGVNAGIMRMVAIDTPFQKQGHGRVLHTLFVKRAKEANFIRLFVNAQREAIGFYRRLGWQDFIWDAEELRGIAADCWQMSLNLSDD